jgi:hypothetical protein
MQISGFDLQGLAEKAEEVVDSLGTYFPILYTQPPNMPGCVTRTELAAAVKQALAAVPVFAAYVIPLLLQKLSSSVRCSLEAFSVFAKGQNATVWYLKSSLECAWRNLNRALLGGVSNLQGCATP